MTTPQIDQKTKIILPLGLILCGVVGSFWFGVSFATYKINNDNEIKALKGRQAICEEETNSIKREISEVKNMFIVLFRELDINIPEKKT